MIRLAKPDISRQELRAVGDVLRSGNLVQGVRVRKFERRVARAIGVSDAVATTSGTAALHLALLALGLGPGDEVIVPDFTFPATANVVELVGATPVLVDIDLKTFNINPSRIGPVLTARTKAIIPVHLFGQPADMDPILRLAKAHRLFVIEDAACALGARYRGRACGAMGDVGCFSFHPRKIITTGEGGMVVTRDGALAKRLRQLRNHGMAMVNGSHQLQQAGLNYRMTEFQAALGVSQMSRLGGLIRRRMALAGAYTRALKGVAGVRPPQTLEGVRHIWQAYVVLLEDGINRDRVVTQTKDHGVETTIGAYALSAQPHYAARGTRIPNAYQAYRQGLCLPLHPTLSASELTQVVTCLRKALHPALS